MSRVMSSRLRCRIASWPFMTAAWILLGIVTCLFLSHPSMAQSVTLDMGKGSGIGEAGTTSRLVQLTVAIAVLSLAPSLLVMMTAFTRIIITLSILRSAIGAQGTPPNTVLIALGLILSLFVMQPTLEKSWDTGIQPLMNGEVEELDGLKASAEPFRDFMIRNVRKGDLATFYRLAHLKPEKVQTSDVIRAQHDGKHNIRKEDIAATPPWRVIIPAFMVGEMSRGFEMGFLLYLPFLIIDLVVSSVLMSLGMMMLPPTSVSIPFKLIFFVLVDGFSMVSGGLVRSFGGG